MIENGWDEGACRQTDVLADEDHAHHLTPQEYDQLQQLLVASFEQDKIPILCQ